MWKAVCLIMAMGVVVGCQSHGTAKNPPQAPLGPVNPPPRPEHRVPTGPTTAARHPWAPTARANDWTWIVIHHSATDRGSAASFDAEHRRRGWDGLGYHFVIDNGNGGADGRVEIGYRWMKQAQGAHAGVEIYNKQGIGICLVGNFDRSKPTEAQYRSLAQLTAWLMRTYNIPPERVIGHRDCKGKHTDCPGRYVDLAWLRRTAAMLSATGR